MDKSVLHRVDASIQRVAFPSEMLQVPGERLDFHLRSCGHIKYVRDVGQRHARFSQQQDSLQAGDCVGPVVPVTVGPDAVWLEQPNLVVVTQRSPADARTFCELVHGPLHGLPPAG